MPGFGSGPFGSGPFGEWKWSRRVLFEYIPELYRQQDADQGGILELFAESLRYSFDGVRRKIRDLGSLRDPLLARTQYSEVKSLRLGPVLGVRGAVDQRGLTASVNALQQFIAPTARFRADDVGKELFVSGSAFGQNNRKVSVAQVINPTTIVTTPLLAVDAGPLRWELRFKVEPPEDRLTVEVRAGDVSTVAPGWLLFDGFADFSVIGRRQFKVPSSEKQLLTEQEGVDGEIDGSGRFKAVTAQLTQADVGKKLSLTGSSVPENNGKFEIKRVVTIGVGDLRAELDVTPALALDTGLTWAILPHEELDISGTVAPRGVVEQEGLDLTIQSTGFSLDLERGSSQRAQIADGAQTGLDITAAITLECWFKLESLPAGGAFYTLMAKNGVAGQNGYTLRVFDQAGPRLGVYLSNDGTNGATGEYVWTGLTAGVEHHVAAVFDPTQTGLANKIKLYVDSLPVTTVTAGSDISSIFNNTDPFQIGAQLAAGADFFDGLIDEVRVWNVARSAAQIADNFAKEVSATATGLAGYWRLQNNYLDETANNNDLTPANSPVFSSDSPVTGETEVTVLSSSASFSASDVGKQLTIRGSAKVPSNDGTYEVTTFLSPTSVKVQQRTPGLQVEALAMTWELRTSTVIGDLVTVTVRAQSLISRLAPDFGIEIDERESEARQRSWVKNVSQWIDLKGTDDSYRIIGAISGFDVTTFQLFRIQPPLLALLPTVNEYEVGEVGAGRSGSDGTLSQQLSLRFRLTAPSALFVATDVGKQIRIKNAAVGGNNKLYTIETVVSGTVVEFLATDTATLPDGNNGILQWSVVRLYTDLAPLLPVFDEVNNDLLEDIVAVTSGGFQDYNADKYCWESDFDSTAHIDVSAVATPSPGVHRVSVSGTDAFPTSPEVVVAVGNWKFLSLTASGAPGTGDSFAGTAPTITLTDAGATFTSADVGKWIKITGAGTAGNNGTFLVTAVPSSTQITYFNGTGVAEAFAGTWQLYTVSTYFLDTVPVLTQALAAGALSGTGDSFSKAGSVITLVDAAGLFTAAHVGKHVLITGATSSGNNGIFLITARPGPTQIQFTNPNGVAEAFSGSWSIGLGIYTFDVASAVAPTSSGPGKLQYRCPTTLTCDYCAASKVYAIVEATGDLLAEGGAAIEDLFERVLARMDEVTPAHVELIVLFRSSVTASLSLSASVEPTII